MGIRGLAGYLKWKLPGLRRPLCWGGHIGARWGIDCSCLMYRARALGLSHVSVLAGLIVRMRYAGIEPIVVFDGRPPAVKADVVESRRVVREAAHKEMAAIQTGLTSTAMGEQERAILERRHADLQRKAPQVTNTDKDDLKQFLYAAGVLFVTAAGEADDVLAYLCQRGILQAVISTDMDMLARGVPRLILPETNDATVLTEICLKNILLGLHLTYPQFVDACTLMGSDYTGRAWKTMEPRIAVDVARRGVVWSEMDVNSDVCASLERGAALLRGEDVVWEDIISERQREKWAAGAPMREPDNLAIWGTKYRWPLEWVRILSYGGLPEVILPTE